VRLWDTTTGARKQTLEGHSNWVFDMAFSPDGKILASGSRDKTVRLWDTATGAWKQTLETGRIIGKPLLFSDDGQYLKTYHGLLNLNCGPPDTYIHREQSIYVISSDTEWVTQDGQNVLWLPPDFRYSSLAIFNNLLALGQSSGQVTFLEFVLS
jgi:WD40 repeat protein